MNNKPWEEELKDVVKGMTPIEPPFDLRSGVMQQIRRQEDIRPLTVHPLLSPTIKKIMLISIPTLMAVALLLTQQSGDTSGYITENRLDFIPAIQLPVTTYEMSGVVKLALMAIFMFTFLQVVNIGRLINKANKGFK